MTGEARADPAASPAPAGPVSPVARRVALTDFRNHARLRLETDARIVAVFGPNGTGKTNLLEALSFLAPGRGLRRARLSEADRIGAPPGARWAVSVEIEGALGPATIGTGREPAPPGEEGAEGGERRTTRIDGKPARAQSALSEHLAVSWLTPPMDRLFLDGAGQRRRFLDRLVHAFDPRHAGRANAYARAARERALLLRRGRADPAWLAALERRMAEAGVAVAAARRELLDRLAPLAREGWGPFPGADLAIACEVGDWLRDGPALAAEDRLREALAAARRAPDGTPAPAPGPHRADLAARHAGRDMPAAACSTGEQKALLIAIALAHARLRARAAGAPPLLLLDEAAAHLDAGRRAALFDILGALGGQVWLTGTDESLFAPLRGRALFLAARDGAIAPC